MVTISKIGGVIVEHAPWILNIVKVSYAVLVSLPASAGKLNFDHIIVSYVYHMHTLHSSDLLCSSTTPGCIGYHLHAWPSVLISTCFLNVLTIPLVQVSVWQDVTLGYNAVCMCVYYVCSYACSFHVIFSCTSH